MPGIPRRRRGGPDRFLYAKLAAFFLGAGLFCGGVATGRDWAVLAAVGVLMVGLALRFLAPDDPGQGTGHEE